MTKTSKYKFISRGGEGVNIQKVRMIKGGQAKCLRLRTRGEEGSNLGEFYAYVLCE